METRYLATPLRRALEKTVREARVVAERGAADAVRRLGIAQPKAPAHLDEPAKALRRRLRAHAQALGDRYDRATGKQATHRLEEAAAYAHWHRMLFARFLAERSLLRHPEHGVPVSLEDCQELAAEQGLPDAWAVAERYAAAMLPAVFQPDDPMLALTLAPEHAQGLKRLVTALDLSVFEAEDSLGWTYQFWRAAEKDAVNKAGGKIGADELPAVTQLFTEPYMVRFLLHNSLGAWWAGKVLAGNPKLAESAPDEAALRQACALPGYTFDILRFVQEGGRWRPAAGTFPGWPAEARAITVLDPCCGSGHFLTEALTILAGLRQAGEGLSAAEAVAAVLRENLFGLEIDGRCVQIAAFAVALSAWRLGGWQALPLPHVAWVGAPPPLPRAEFVALANGDAAVARGLEALHDLFRRAPLLGSLIEPSGGDLVNPTWLANLDSVMAALAAKAQASEPERAEGAVAARGMADSASILARRYTLQTTNVPFLGRGGQDPVLADHIANAYSDAKADLATAMVSRMLRLASRGGTVASVTPQNWMYLKSYRRFRERLLRSFTLDLIGALGPRAFETIGGEVVNTVLAITSIVPASSESMGSFIDANEKLDPAGKSKALFEGDIQIQLQARQLANPDSIVSCKPADSTLRLDQIAMAAQGIVTRDNERYISKFWEIARRRQVWQLMISPPAEAAWFAGRESVLRWEQGRGPLHSEGLAHNFPPLRIMERTGVLISQVGTFRTYP